MSTNTTGFSAEMADSVSACYVALLQQGESLRTALAEGKSHSEVEHSFRTMLASMVSCIELQQRLLRELQHSYLDAYQ